MVGGAGKGGHRRGIKGTASKRVAQKHLHHSHHSPADSKMEEVESVCDNSNDSGLGFDHQVELSHPNIVSTTYAEPEYWSLVEGAAVLAKKRRLVDIKLETDDDPNDDFTFPKHPSPQAVVIRTPISTVIPPQPPSVCVNGGGDRRETGAAGGGTRIPVTVVGCGKGRRVAGVSSVHSGGIALSRDGKVELRIVSQPEPQHRARYQTEGSRGAIKDASGNGFPIVKLTGYDRPATLEVYIGTDQGRIAPHMFYQACKVSGKNSTPCLERKLNGTILIQIEFDPSKDMVVTCDCVGILKERNVDVEQRFPDDSSTSTSRNSRKKSTRCRMVFRTTISRPDGSLETLQVTSHPIICTQPPGIPEICKKSLSSCPCVGGVELFILGKNFLKDTRVVFSEGHRNSVDYWEASVIPDKDFLHQSHLVCNIPPYRADTVVPEGGTCVKLCIISGGRKSDVQAFLYTPAGTAPCQVLPQEYSKTTRSVPQSLPSVAVTPAPVMRTGLAIKPALSFVETPKQEILSPPPLSQPPTHVYVSSVLKGGEESSWVVGDSRQSGDPPSMATLMRRFVTSAPLPALSVDTFLSRLEAQDPQPQQQVPPPPSVLGVGVVSGVLVGNGSSDTVVPQNGIQHSPVILTRTSTVAPLLTTDAPTPSTPSATAGTSLLSPTSAIIPPQPTLLPHHTAPPSSTSLVDLDLLATAGGVTAVDGGSLLIGPSLVTPDGKVALIGSTPGTTTSLAVSSSPTNPSGLLVSPSLASTGATAFLPSDAAAGLLMEMNKEKSTTPPTASTALSSPPPTPAAQHCPTTITAASDTPVGVVVVPPTTAAVKKMEDTTIPLHDEITQMSEHDLLSYINPSCFDQV